ncbi:uncharacterized protein [Panulirus ornatus]|uniref:uncharacterized protein isoform X2 n=1 Tax=Panulirus ornatus TaxID=150431 RepID=UPI003A8366B6
MKERQLVLMVIFVVAIVAPSVEGNFLADGWASLSSQAKDAFQNVGESFKSTQHYLEKKFKELSEKVKEWLNQKSFKTATADELLRDIPEDGWKEIEPALLMTANKSEIAKLIEIGEGKIPERFLDELERLLIMRLSDEEAINIAQAAEKLTQSDVVTLMTRLGKPDRWSATNIADLGPIAMRLPICLDKIENKTALMKMKQIIKDCQKPKPLPSCPEESDLQEANRAVYRKTHGAISSWNTANLTDIGGLANLMDDVINNVGDEFVRDAKNDIIKLTFGKEESSTANAWKKMLCRAEGCHSMGKNEAKTWYDGLGNLKKYVMPSDLSAAALEDASLKSELIANAKDMSDNIKAKDSMLVLKDELKNKIPENITKAEIEAMGSSLFTRAPACFLKKAATRKLLNTLLNDASRSIAMMQGAESLSKTMSLMDTTMDAALVDNVLDFSKVPESLMAHLSPWLLENMKKDHLRKLVLSSSESGHQLTPFQISTVLSSFSARETSEFPPIIKEYLPTSKLRDLSKDHLAELLPDMSTNSLPCFMGAKMAFGNKEIITPDELTEGIEFLPCMSADDAEKIAPDDLFKAFMVISKSGKPLSKPACRVFRDKMVDWGNVTLGGDKHNHDTVASQLYLKDIMFIPPCVIVDFGKKTQIFLNKEMKTVLMMNMCQMEDQSSFSRMYRISLVNSFVEDMVGDTNLGKCDLNRLRNCIFDLDSENLKKLDEVASSFYIQSLQEAFMKPVPPCLDEAQKQQTGELLVKVKGAPATWKDANDVSHLLSMLPSDKLMEIPKEVLSSIPSPKEMSPFDDNLPEWCKKSFNEGNMRIREKQKEICMQMRKEDGRDTQCDMISCRGVTVMSESDVEKLTTQEVMDNLALLGTDDMGKEKAKILLDKVKEVKNITDLTNQELKNLGFIWQAFTAEDVADMPSFKNGVDKEVIYEMCHKLMPDMDVMEAVVNKVQTEYKDPTKMSSRDLLLVGPLLCFYNTTSINAIPDKIFRSSMRVLGMLDCGKEELGTRNLADKAVAAYRTSQDQMSLTSMDAATLNEMNKLVGGLKPEDLMKIPESAFVGLTSAGMKSISPDAVNVLKTGQIKNLGPSAAFSVTGEQQARFTSEQKNAFNGFHSSNSFAGETIGQTHSWVLSALIVMAVMLMA